MSTCRQIEEEVYLIYSMCILVKQKWTDCQVLNSWEHRVVFSNAYQTTPVLPMFIGCVRSEFLFCKSEGL